MSTDTLPGWIAKGVRKGWISEPRCDTHDVVPKTDAEWQKLDEGDDECIWIVRIWGRDD
jgi:hypothetical protein